MKISEAERVAINSVITYGALYGYGNLIAHLQTAWARDLLVSGWSEKTARLASGGKGYPFLMQDDLLQRGEWDETGARYMASSR